MSGSLNDKVSRILSRTDFSSLAFLRTIAAAIVLLGSTPADALNIIDLSPIEQSVQVGSDFTLDITMAFDEVTVGGGLEISFSSELTFLSFSFDPALTANFGMLSPADGETSLPLEIAFGWLPFAGGGGPMGLTTVGQLTFRAQGPGPVAIVMTASSGSSPGPYYGLATGEPMAVEFGSATLNIVPEPGTALLLGLGLIGLARVGRVASHYARPIAHHADTAGSSRRC